MNAPRRRYCLIATIQGDTPDAVAAMIEELRAWFAERGEAPPPGESVHGGPDRSWTLRLEVRPEVTSESYARAVRQYLDELNLASFEPKPVAFCAECEAAVFSDAVGSDGERILCPECVKEKPSARP